MYDVIVIGGGHAGVEASLVCARLNKKTLLCTINKKYIASMPCNPSIGGPAKGIVVREIDAIGGEMGRAADLTALQFKMLNTTKGPGVQSLRVQSDKNEYAKYMQDTISKTKNLEVLEGIVSKVVVEDKKIVGVIVDDKLIKAKAVILTAGTFMSGAILVGHTSTMSGPDGEPTTNDLSQSLRDNGIETFRLKTGTPARIKTSTIDFTKTQLQPGTDEFLCFSSKTKESEVRAFSEQLVCYLTYTTLNTHNIINNNLEKSAMYSGLVKGVGPRYCPSIEDKLVRFKDKERHQLFLEPETKDFDTTYVQGFSTSMPIDIQELMIKSLPGLENAVIDKYAYAIEYDAIDPLQMKKTMESKIIDNLYTAGQVNGTSGYEEAAAQGLMAGINASLKIDNEEPLILGRDEAYIGVMIDDLCTKGTQEPYRLLTSRAEYRLLLRHDNAEDRLKKYSYDIGLSSIADYNNFLEGIKDIQATIELLSNERFTPKSDINKDLIESGYDKLNDGISAYELLKRPNITIDMLSKYINIDLNDKLKKKLEIEVKYEGYIKKARNEANKISAMDDIKIPLSINYDDVLQLSLEGRQKLNKVAPLTIGQASRISGVNPADISVLLIYLKQNKEIL